MRGGTVEQVAIEPHRAGLVPKGAADAVDKRTFAGTVRSNKPDALAGPHRQRNALERNKAAEALAQTVDIEHGRHPVLPGASTPTSRRPTSSSGLCRKYLCTS